MKTARWWMVVAWTAGWCAAATAAPGLVFQETWRDAMNDRRISIEGSLTLTGAEGLRAVEVRALEPAGDGESLDLAPLPPLGGTVLLSPKRLADPGRQVFALVFSGDPGTQSRLDRMELATVRCETRGTARPTITARGIRPDGAIVQIPVSFADPTISGTGPDLLLAPNPALGLVDIHYQVATPSNVEITVYDLRGRKIRTVFSGKQEAGDRSVRWNGRDDRDLEVPLGVYFLKALIGSQLRTERLVLVR